MDNPGRLISRAHPILFHHSGKISMQSQNRLTKFLFFVYFFYYFFFTSFTNKKCRVWFGGGRIFLENSFLFFFCLPRMWRLKYRNSILFLVVASIELNWSLFFFVLFLLFSYLRRKLYSNWIMSYLPLRIGSLSCVTVVAVDADCLCWGWAGKHGAQLCQYDIRRRIKRNEKKGERRRVVSWETGTESKRE